MTPHSSNFGLSPADMQAIASALFQSECELASQSDHPKRINKASANGGCLLRRIEDSLGSIA